MDRVAARAGGSCTGRGRGIVPHPRLERVWSRSGGAAVRRPTRRGAVRDPFRRRLSHPRRSHPTLRVLRRRRRRPGARALRGAVRRSSVRVEVALNEMPAPSATSQSGGRIRAERKTLMRRLLSFTAAIVLAAAPAARPATFYAANDGNDGPSHCLCGGKAGPCRSITCAITRAAPGDKIIVGPGVYGDLNANGTPGEAGEETPSPGCNCVLSINKPVVVVSSGGAAATVISSKADERLRQQPVRTGDTRREEASALVCACHRAVIGPCILSSIHGT